MCLIVLAWQTHPDYPLILAANRDEFHARAADAMDWWRDNPTILGGRDLRAGGTWLAISKRGRIATVTNYRENGPVIAERSRGDIVTQFVAGIDSPERFAATLDGAAYAGFSALVAERDTLVCSSNRGDVATTLGPGIFGLSNASLDTPWPKLVRCKARLKAVIDEQSFSLDSLLSIIADREPPTTEELMRQDLPFAMTRPISAPFIVDSDYGTRCSTVLRYRQDGYVELAERRFDPSGDVAGESRFVFLTS